MSKFSQFFKKIIKLNYFAGLLFFGMASIAVSEQAPNGLKADIELKANSGAFEFNGVSPGLDLGNSSILHLSDNDFTAMAWVRFNYLAYVPGYQGYCGADPTYGCDMSIVDKMGHWYAINQDGWRVLKDSENKFVFCFGGAGYNGCGNPNTTVFSQTIAQQDVWYHVAVSKTGTTFSIYVNGALEATSSLVDFSDTNSTNLLIGWNSSEGEYLNGKIDDVKLFSGTLKSAKIMAIYKGSQSTHNK